jgi:hypothetical protein
VLKIYLYGDKPMSEETKTVAEMLNELIETLNGVVEDAEKFDSGNQAAGTRVRKALQTVVNGGKDLRKAIQEIKNAK